MGEKEAKCIEWKPSPLPKVTKRDRLHKIETDRVAWVLSIRGPWVDYWYEIRNNEKAVKMTHGRKDLAEIPVLGDCWAAINKLK